MWGGNIFWKHTQTEHRLFTLPHWPAAGFMTDVCSPVRKPKMSLINVSIHNFQKFSSMLHNLHLWTLFHPAEKNSAVEILDFWLILPVVNVSFQLNWHLWVLWDLWDHGHTFEDAASCWKILLPLSPRGMYGEMNELGLQPWFSVSKLSMFTH